jgi:NAD(P)-dependent dehydrogenase (short-subunit alcohol dehydrogenase family)
MLARSNAYLKKLSEELRRGGGEVIAMPVDLTRENQIVNAFKKIQRQWGRIDVLIYNASEASWKGLLKLTPQEFERAWRVCVLGAFLCTREAARGMVKRKSGTIIFTGATSSVRVRKGAVDFSSAKFGLRGLAESLARELWPKGIHVAHTVIDGMIDTPAVRRKFHPKPGEPLLQPDAIAEAYWSLVQQKRAAWTSELDVRPHKEDFYV